MANLTTYVHAYEGDAVEVSASSVDPCRAQITIGEQFTLYTDPVTAQELITKLTEFYATHTDCPEQH